MEIFCNKMKYWIELSWLNLYIYIYLGVAFIHFEDGNWVISLPACAPVVGNSIRVSTAAVLIKKYCFLLMFLCISMVLNAYFFIRWLHSEWPAWYRGTLWFIILDNCSYYRSPFLHILQSHHYFRHRIKRKQQKQYGFITVTSQWPTWRLKPPAFNCLSIRLFKLTSKKISKPVLLALW